MKNNLEFEQEIILYDISRQNELQKRDQIKEVGKNQVISKKNKVRVKESEYNLGDMIGINMEIIEEVPVV